VLALRDLGYAVFAAVRVYPSGGHGIFGNAVQLWRRDIGSFLARWVAPPPSAAAGLASLADD
jgi:hypothetical protein